jgi:hypothetical protein
MQHASKEKNRQKVSPGEKSSGEKEISFQEKITLFGNPEET